MRLRQVFTVYAKELRETLRDRRTLFVMVLLPLVMYPISAIVAVEWFISHEAGRQAKRSRVVVGGAAEEAGALVEALRAPETRLEVVVVPNLVVDRGRGTAALAGAGADAIVEPPEGFAAALREGRPAAVRVYFDASSDVSKLAQHRIVGALEGLAQAERARRLARHGLEPSFLEPVPLEPVNLATRAKVGRTELAKVLPFVLVLMLLMGSFYPAIDLTAGEKERGTLEPLFATPVSRQAIVAGKFLTVATVSALTGVLNVTCMAAAGLWIARSAADAAGHGLPLGSLARALPWGAIGLGLLALAIATLLFSALMMAVAALARNFKEAQNFLTPVYLVASLPAMSAWLPGTSLGYAEALIPIANVTLLLKDAISGALAPGPAAAALAATAVYAALSMAAASRIYESERLLFAPEEARGAGRSFLMAFLRGGRAGGGEGGRAGVGAGAGAGENPHFLRPSPLEPGEAMAVFAIAAMLLIVFGPTLQRRGLGGMAAAQVLLIGLPAVVAARALTGSAIAALGVRLPPARQLVGAALIGASAWYVIVAIILPVQQWILPIPKELVREIERAAMPAGASLVAVLLGTAVAPAICEELLCRGALTRGLRGALGPTGAVLVSAGLFGLLHFSVHRFLPTFAIGLVLGAVTLVTRSVVASMVVHALHNAALILLSGPRGAGAAAWIEAHPAAGGALALAALGTGFALVLLPREAAK